MPFKNKRQLSQVQKYTFQSEVIALFHVVLNQCPFLWPHFLKCLSPPFLPCSFLSPCSPSSPFLKWYPITNQRKTQKISILMLLNSRDKPNNHLPFSSLSWCPFFPPPFLPPFFSSWKLKSDCVIWLFVSL